MSTAVAPAPPPTIPATPPSRGWLVGPAFDALFVANLAWPLVVLAALAGPWATGPLSFVQVYLVSTPHRWVTLVLVFLDRDHFWSRPVRFGGLGLLLVGLGLALVGAAVLAGRHSPAVTDSLLFLMLLDYAWNAWHFAAQHAGVARIYGRLAQPGQSPASVAFERWALRLPVLWMFLRLAAHTAAHAEPLRGLGLSELSAVLMWGDPLSLALPGLVLAGELAAWRPAALGRVLYLASVWAIYAAFVLAVGRTSDGVLFALYLATQVFHASEYLAVVGWSVRRKRGGVWAYVAPRAALAVPAFMAVLGLAAYLVSSQWAYTWALATLLVSLLHYAYDGMIWRARPAPARAG